MRFFDDIGVSRYFRSSFIDGHLKNVDTVRYTQFIIIAVQSTVYIQGCIMSLSGLMILNDSFLQNLLHITSLDEETFTSNFMLALYGGGILGAMCSYLFSDNFGRQRTMTLSTLCCFVSLLSNAISYDLVTFLLSRFMIGFSLGLILSVGPLYLSEISPAESRGRNISSTALSINIGLVISGLSYLVFHKIGYGWRLCMTIPICTSFVSVYALVYVPESPRWLLAKKTPAECLDALRDIRRCSDVSVEFNIIYASLLSDARLGDGWLDLFQTSSIFYRLALACFLQLSQQLVGIQLISTYSANVLSSLSIHSTAIALVMAYIASFIGSMLCLIRVDKWGRRFVMLSGCMCMLLSWFGALLSIYAGGLDDGKSELYYSSYVLKFFFGAFLALFCCFYAFSLGPLGWVASVEIFPARARAKASAACTSCYSLSYILGAWLLNSWRINILDIQQSIAVFCAVIFTVGAVCYAFLPETSQVNLDEMEIVFDIDDKSCLYCRGKSIFLGLSPSSEALMKSSATNAHSTRASDVSDGYNGSELIDPDTLHKYSSSMQGVKFEYYTRSGSQQRDADGLSSEADPLIVGKYQSTSSSSFSL